MIQTRFHGQARSFEGLYNNSSMSRTMPRFHTYVSVLVGGYGDELGLWKGETLSLHVITQAHVLHPVLRHLHDEQPRLVLVQRLQDNHLQGENLPLVSKCGYVINGNLPAQKKIYM